MKIARVTVVDGKAVVEIDGCGDVPVVVSEGQTLWLDMLVTDHGGVETIRMEWMEVGEQKSMTIAARPIQGQV